MGERMTEEGKRASTNSENDQEETWAKLAKVDEELP
jgi:hypothetical protein